MTMLPISLKEPLQRHLEKVKATHEKDLKAETELSSAIGILEYWNKGFRWHVSNDTRKLINSITCRNSDTLN